MTYNVTSIVTHYSATGEESKFFSNFSYRSTYFDLQLIEIVFLAAV